MSKLSQPGVWRIDAAGLCDAELSIAPASLVVRRGGAGVEVIAAAGPAEIDHHPAAASAKRIKLPDAVLLPGLVNAHTHLDLTSIGPRDYDPRAGFPGFVDLVRRERPSEARDIDRAVRQGVQLLHSSGTVAVGDIAGAPAGRPTLTAFETLKALGMRGVSYLEFFAIGHGEAPAMARVEQALYDATPDSRGRIMLGLQPHAPTTVSRRAFAWAIQQAAQRGMRICTHLAETMDEREFIADGGGPHRAFLEKLGLWNETAAADVGQGATPIAHFGPRLLESGASVVHLNDVRDGDLSWLRHSVVVYCPQASEYFLQHEVFGPHPYRTLMASGVKVALGTDSIINQPSGELSVLREMRLLFRRDGGGDPQFARQLLAMGTVNGAASLGLPEEQVRLGAGAKPIGILAVGVKGPVLDAAGAVLNSDSAISWVWGGQCE